MPSTASFLTCTGTVVPYQYLYHNCIVLAIEYCSMSYLALLRNSTLTILSTPSSINSGTSTVDRAMQAWLIVGGSTFSTNRLIVE